MFCEFCEREVEITEDCVFLPKFGSRYQLVRMPDGRIHQFLDVSDPDAAMERLKKAGAVVTPPKPPEAPAPVQAVDEAIEPIIAEVAPEPASDVDTLVEQLKHAWQHEISEPEYSEPERLRGVVVSWSGKCGLIRKEGDPKRSRTGLFFRTSDIAGVLPEAITPGMSVTFELGPPNEGHEEEGFAARYVEFEYEM